MTAVGLVTGHLVVAFGAGYLLRVALGWIWPGPPRERPPTPTDLLAGEVSRLTAAMDRMTAEMAQSREWLEREGGR